MAEGIFRHLVEESALAELFAIDSAGTGAWHVGEPPDDRARAVAAQHGVDLVGSARQVTPDDLARFDYVIAMDRENLRALKRMGGLSQEGVMALLRDFDDEGGGEDVPDPYYGGPDGFENVYNMILRSCRALLREIESGGVSA